MKRAIITGATSMLGLALIDQLISRQVEVYAVIRGNSKKRESIGNQDRIHVIECDADQYDKLPELITVPCDVFYHFAWQGTGPKRNDNIDLQIDNIKYTLKAVRAAKEMKCQLFIGAGSQAEYGTVDLAAISPDTPVNPVQAYGIAKYAAGRYAMEESKRLDMKCIWVRVFSVYGTRDKATSMISTSVKAMLAGDRMSYTPAEQEWDYLNEKDAGRAFYLLGKKGRDSKVYCLGFGKSKKLSEYIITIRNTVNPNLEIGIGDIPYPKNPVMHLCADISDLQKDVGFEPEIRFEDGIAELSAYVQSRKLTEE